MSRPKFICFVCLFFYVSEARPNPIIEQRLQNFVDRKPPVSGYDLDLVPIIRKGSCKGGTQYLITDTDTLHRLKDEIECVFWSGITPNKIALGLFYGNVIEVLNSNLFDPLTRIMWGGKFGVMSKCRNRPDIHMSFNFVAKHLLIPAALSIGRCTLNLGPGEYTDNSKHFMIDYSTNFAELCPYDTNFLYQLDMGVVNNYYPFNQVVDVVRAVGRTDDGGVILLGKTYLKDPWREDNEAVTVAFWYVVNYDDELLPNFKRGSPLPPLKESFDYFFPGAVSFGISRIVPIGQIIVDPVETFQVFMDYVVRWPQGIFVEDQQKKVESGKLDDEDVNPIKKNDISRARKEFIRSVGGSEVISMALQEATEMSRRTEHSTGSIAHSTSDKLMELRHRLVSGENPNARRVESFGAGAPLLDDETANRLSSLTKDEIGLIAAALAIHTVSLRNREALHTNSPTINPRYDESFTHQRPDYRSYDAIGDLPNVAPMLSEFARLAGLWRPGGTQSLPPPSPRGLRDFETGHGIRRRSLHTDPLSQKRVA